VRVRWHCRVIRVGRDRSEILDDLLGAFRFPCPRLARDKDALVFALLPHIHPGTLGNGKDVWWILVASMRAILLYY
jgi:hypothetical protein